MSTKLERCGHANQLIQSIARHGRKFFWSQSKSRMARMEVDERGKVWFVDDHSGARIYTHYSRHWRGFSHGGTLRDLVILMRDYIRTGQKVPLYLIAPNRGFIDGNHDMWGYGAEQCAALRADIAGIPIIELPAGAA